MTLINKTIVVGEGNLVTVSNASLFVKTKETSDFIYTVEHGPTNGDLLKMTATGKSEIMHSGSTITTGDILSNFIFYQHDDSETTNDTFR